MTFTLPSGTTTFLFTDIEGSTKLWELHPEAMRAALARHDEILRTAIASNHGQIIKTRGDGVHAGFSNALDAANAALNAQRGLQAPIGDLQLKVRMGVYTGEAELRAGDYYGPALNRSARLMSAAHGGQILLSNATAELIRDQLPVGASLRDLGEHRLKDLSRPEHIFQLTHPDLPEEFPPIHTIDAFPNNLPIQLTSFIGRDREIMEAKKTLSSTRVMTFIGPGGTGKTRLVLQLADELLSEFRDGIWFIELSSLTNPAYIISSIASILNLREVQGIPLSAIVDDYLREKHLLLILDNCEHLIEACAQITDHLLRTCAKIKIITSSREALGIDGESVYRVPSLSLPEQPTDSLLDYEATRLFIERAVKNEPRFMVTRENSVFIIQICRRLDGIPLAIELAAARVKLFTPAQICERLNDRFKLLSGGSRTALPRQQTLRALIDWSYLALHATEQRGLRQFAVFSGGWTMEAAEAVLGEFEALDTLLGLVQKSLVLVDEQDGNSRYRLLETIRQYALEKLVEANEATETHSRHLKYFMGLGGKSNRMMSVFDAMFNLEWLDVIEHDYGNMRAALEWALESDPEAAAELAIILNPYWSVRDLNSEAKMWCKAILERTQNMDRARAKVLGILAWSLVTLSDMREGLEIAKEGVEVSRRAGDRDSLARSLSALAMASMFTGEPEAAMQAVREAEATAREAHFKEGIAMSLGMKASVQILTGGDPKEAKKIIEEAMQVAKEAGMVYGLTLAGMGMGRLASRLGDLAGARKEFMRSAELAQRAGNRRIYASCTSELAHALRQNGKLDEAVDCYKIVLPIWQDLGHRGAIAHELECFGYIAIKKSQFEKAARYLGTGDAIRKMIHVEITGVELAEYEQELSALRAGIDEDKRKKAWADGTQMSIDEAIQRALEDTYA